MNRATLITVLRSCSWAVGRGRGGDCASGLVLGSIESVIAASVSVRLRYFGSRPLLEHGSERSNSTIMLDAQAGYQINKTWTITAEVLNVFDRCDHDVDYFYESRMRPGDTAREEHRYHPVETIQMRLGLAATS